MKILGFNLTRFTPYSIYQRRIRPIYDRHARYSGNWQKRFILNVTNICNLQCYSCSAQCDKPMGTTPFRDTPRTQSINHVDKWLTHFEGYRPEYWIRLTGGEPTLTGPDYLEELCEVIHRHGRSVSILTNGARFTECDPWWFEQVVFDNHISNRDAIEKSIAHMKNHEHAYYYVTTTQVHRNLERQRTNHITQGLRCPVWLENISLWRNVVYPCCVLYYLDGWDGNNKIRDSLIDAGWHVENPDLMTVIENWQQTVPAEVVKACLLSCWQGGPNIEYQEVNQREN